MSSLVSMGDAIAFSLLGDKHEQYGAQRVWGSIGWGLFTIIAGEDRKQINSTQLNNAMLSITSPDNPIKYEFGFNTRVSG